MMIGMLVLAIATLLFWVIFFKLKLLRLTPGWIFGFSVFFLHLALIFVIGLRFVTPYSTSATIIQHTIQLIPRLSEPTLITEVLVEDNMPVRKGDPLFKFDRTIYEARVNQLKAQLAAAQQNVKVLGTNIKTAENQVVEAEAALAYSTNQMDDYNILIQKGVGRLEQAIKWRDTVKGDTARLHAAQAELQVARLQYESSIDGVHTSVANLEADLQQAQFYLDNTVLNAPEDGRVINLQVRPGMVSGILRIGGIAVLIAEDNRYLLATYFQENLKYVAPGQYAEVAFDLYPGQIFKGRVDSIWKANGQGQLLPTAEIPRFEPVDPSLPQGQYAVKILLDDRDQSKFPIGAQGSVAIYVNGDRGAWAALRKVAIRMHTWLAWLYPLNI
ncbi:HlyD family secretion protein [Starkeya sp. 3C]|uniref:HlyD family secretion protein n=1 Tax=Ancylobacter moscoviensis TaxID=2597768 RepID=A0ABY3DWI9_9HYPH|nr:biotin/lipoyl-binding protein [Ancylobacter moscoviensis]TSJ64491.1 HlyD family secretion protein [Ancylobacter moscoviensis]